MNEIQTTANARQLTWIRAIAAACGVAALAVFAPVVWLAASGGVGLLVLGGILGIGFAAVQALPLLGQKLENNLLNARKAEARRNPIEQLQNEVLRRAERLRAFRQACSLSLKTSPASSAIPKLTGWIAAPSPITR